MEKQRLFWLHIRKSGGTATRVRLPDHLYRKTDRHRYPQCFIQAEPAEWNDIVNNHRVVMGEHTFRRALFAKEVLYKDEWDNVLSFAFARDPLARCLSMFHYVFWRNNELAARLLDTVRIYRLTNRVSLTDSRAFDIFLDMLDECLNNKEHSIEWPNLHFRTHVARMSEDITDHAGNILLKRVYRLEWHDRALQEILGELGERPLEEPSDDSLMNRTKQKRFQPNRRQIRKVEELYKDDFEIYESARV